jgi:hypothetical protein
MWMIQVAHDAQHAIDEFAAAQRIFLERNNKVSTWVMQTKADQAAAKQIGKT